MIGYYNVSVILTYVGLVCAMFGMPLALNGHIHLSACLLMICGLCDCFDGSVARLCKRSDSEKRFGIEIDSLCDLVCFGVYPAVLGYAVGMTEVYWMPVMALFVLAGVIRLGYFNVQEIERFNGPDSHRTWYEGLPITTSSMAMTLALVLDGFVGAGSAVIYPWAMLAVGLLFVMKIRIPKLYGKKLLLLAGIGAVIFVLVSISGPRLNALHG